MKTVFHIALICLCHLLVSGQRGLYVNGAEASVRIDSVSFLSVDGDFVNQDCDPVAKVRFNGAMFVSGSFTSHDSLEFQASTNSSAGKPKLIFRTTSTYPAGQNAVLNGTSPISLWHTVVDKPGGGVTLQADVYNKDTVTFVAGKIFLNGRTWYLEDPAGAVSVLNHPWIKNETSASRFMGVSNLDTGRIVYHTTYPQGSLYNPANLGIQLLGPVDHGSTVQFERGCRAQAVANAGGANYYYVNSPAYSLSTNSVVLRHFASDAQYYPPAYFHMPLATFYISGGSGAVWTRLNPYSSGPYVFGSVTQSTMGVSMSVLAHPNVALDGKSLRFTLGDPLCVISPVSDIHDDTLFLCSGITTTLNAGSNVTVPNTSLRYEWNSTPVSYAQLLAVPVSNQHQRFKVVISDVKGCITRDSVAIAPGRPSPQFKYVNHLNACDGDSITIKDTVELRIGTFAVSMFFSDLTSFDSVGNVLRKKFDGPGQYSVDIMAMSSNGCMSVVSITNIQVYPMPTADFDFSHDCVTDAVTFTSTSVSNHTSLSISQTLWNFADSATQTIPLPSHTFPGAGTYPVKLNVASSFGCKDSTTANVVIHPRNHAGFLKDNHCLGTMTSFTNITACNTGGCVYQWTLDSGSFSSDISPNVKYSSAGARMVKLNVTGAVGCPDSASALVFVHPRPFAQFSLSQPSACVNFPIYLTNATTVSSGSIFSNSWQFGNGQVAGSTHATANYSVAGSFPVKLVAVSDSGCVDSVIHVFTSLPQPVARFGVNNVCSGQQSEFMSTAQGQGLSHLWQLSAVTSKGTGSVTSLKYSYPLAGIYTPTLMVTDSSGCSDTISAKAVVRSTPSLDLGGVIKTCGYSYTLDALNPGCSYQWFPGYSTGQTLITQASGFYNVSVTATNGCATTSSVSLTLNGEVLPELGNDTTVCENLIIDAGYPGSSFQWMNGDTTQQINVTSSGFYIVQVTDKNNCSGSDSIFVTILEKPEVMLPPDTILCVPENGITLMCNSNAASLTWNTGEKSDSIRISSGGVYWVTGVANNGCENMDTTRVSFLATPALDLGRDTGACGFVDLNAMNAGCTYFWYDSSAVQFFRVVESAKVWLRVTNPVSGCSVADTTNVEIFPTVDINLGNDTVFCSGSTIVLNVNNPGSYVQWLTGSGDQTMNVTASGVYGAEVVNQFGCMGSDYIKVTVLPSPTVELGNDLRYICGDQPLVLSSPYDSDNSWHSVSGSFSNEKNIVIATAGKYWLKVTSGECAATDSVTVSITNNTIQAMFLASTMDTVNKPVKFVNLSSPEPLSQTWWFGDGSTSTELSPVHTYVLPTDFSVTLEVNNGYCSDRVTKALSVLFRERGEDPDPGDITLEFERFLVYPNPASSEITCYTELNNHAYISVQLTDLSGKTLHQISQKKSEVFETTIPLDELANGFYLLHLRATSERGALSRNVKFIKTN